MPERLMAVTTSTAALITRPSMRIFSYNASTQTTGYSASKARLRKASTCSSSPRVISETWLADMPSMPSALAGRSTLRVETPLTKTFLDDLRQRLLASLSLLPRTYYLFGPQNRGPPPPFSVLTPVEARTIEALRETIR